jgi:quercetin dioxygenase-like cupin family protein
MKRIEFLGTIACGDSRFEASVLFEQGAVKVRRIELAAGARIPPCRMQEDVLFVVIGGRVTFRSEDEVAIVEAPGAVFIQGGATTRSMEADESSLVLAVLCRHEAAAPTREEPKSKT